MQFKERTPFLSILKDKRNLYIIIGALALAGVLLFFSMGHNVLTNNAFPPPEVSVLQMIPQDVELKQEYHGMTEGSLNVEVRAKVGGTLLERTYAEGQLVKQGDILFKIDSEPFQAALAKAEANLKNQLARLTKAEHDWKRVSEVYKEKYANDSDRDLALSNFEQAKASVQQAEAEVKAAQINLEYTAVKAPVTGLASQATKSEGNLIGTSADANLLTRIIQLDPIYVNFAYPDNERFAQQKLLTQGLISMPSDNQLKANLKFEDGTPHPFQGYVSFTDNSIEQQTGAINARAIIPNPDHQVLSGQFVVVETTGIVRKNALVVPAKAIMQGPNGTFVYTVDKENKAVINPVTLGSLIDKGQIVDTGLKENDSVIVEGMIKARPGQVVGISAGEDAKDKKKESEG
jgi:membrane fusion protein, multidrug efflux system